MVVSSPMTAASSKSEESFIAKALNLKKAVYTALAELSSNGCSGALI